MRESLDRFRPRKRLGQNFLVNQGAADTIVAAFRPRPDDRVLEVGPGHGVLTHRLAGRVLRLTAVEIDPGLALPLREELKDSPSVEILEADILDLDLTALLLRLGATPERPARLIANLPYAIATTIILRLLDQGDLLADLLVLVQREVAERIASSPGRKSYGGLSVLCQAQAKVEILLRLRPGSFRPIPKVESSLVHLTLRRAREGSRPDGETGPPTLSSLLRTAFALRRKTLLNNLERLPGPKGASIGPSTAEEVIRRAGLDPRARPEAIPVEGFLALLRTVRAL